VTTNTGGKRGGRGEREREREREKSDKRGCRLEEVTTVSGEREERGREGGREGERGRTQAPYNKLLSYK